MMLIKTFLHWLKWRNRKIVTIADAIAAQGWIAAVPYQDEYAARVVTKNGMQLIIWVNSSKVRRVAFEGELTCRLGAFETAVMDGALNRLSVARALYIL